MGLWCGQRKSCRRVVVVVRRSWWWGLPCGARGGDVADGSVARRVWLWLCMVACCVCVCVHAWHFLLARFILGTLCTATRIFQSANVSGTQTDNCRTTIPQYNLKRAQILTTHN